MLYLRPDSREQSYPVIMKTECLQLRRSPYTDVRARKKGVLATHNEHENTRKNQIGTQEVNVILYNLRSLNPG